MRIMACVRSFTLMQLRYFEAVARSGNITVAAAKLRVTQSTLSAAISQLEKDIGAKLFIRIPRKGVQLTAAGRRLLSGSVRLLEEAEQLATVVHGEQMELKGELNVGLFAPIAPFIGPIVLREFEKKHPQVHVNYVEGDQAALVRAVKSGDVELAVMYDIGVTPDLLREQIKPVIPHVLIASDHPLAKKNPISIYELKDEPFILLDLPHTREYFLQAFRQVGIEPKIRHRASGYETVRSFVGQGHGYSLLNMRTNLDVTYQNAKVTTLETKEEMLPVHVTLVRLPGVRPSTKSVAFAASVKDYFSRKTGLV